MKAKVKSKLGQNFLVDAGAQRRIVEALGPAVRGTVLEIGPGKAAITELVAERAGRLVAIEVDPPLVLALRSRFAGQPNVEIIANDVLAVDLTALARAHSESAGPEDGSTTHSAEGIESRSAAVIGNLPYYITSPILQHLFLHERVLSRAVLMVQREVAERMTAMPGNSEYGALSVLCQLHASLDLLFTLPPDAFDPPPKVHSSVVRLEFAPRWTELGIDREPFTRFLRACFAQKRKTLGNNLRSAGYAPAAVTAALESSGRTATSRAEELSPEELAQVFRSLRGPRPAA